VKRILVIEDDHRLSHNLCVALKREGYECDVADNGNDALRSFQQNSFQLILMDINLPGMNGVDLCKVIRKSNAQIPILVISAFGDIDTKLEVFTTGADDYITKPFHMQELIAKIRIFMRRTERPMVPLPSYSTKDLQLDPNRKIAIREGKEIQLMPKEYGVLEYLVINHNRIVSKEELASNLWPEYSNVTDNTIEVYINLLRNKIDKGHEKKLIFTRPNYGYYLNESQDTPGSLPAP